jgi:hypothetical protein
LGTDAEFLGTSQGVSRSSSRRAQRRIDPRKTSQEARMVRRGSTVRVRQRAYLETRSRCKRRLFCCRLRHSRPPPLLGGGRRSSRTAEPPKMPPSSGLRPYTASSPSSGDRFWGQSGALPCLVRQRRLIQPRVLALFAVGAAKGRVTRLSLRRSGLQVMIVGSLSADVGLAIGHIVTTSPDKKASRSENRSRPVGVPQPREAGFSMR